jgi:hypothetical protein
MDISVGSSSDSSFEPQRRWFFPAAFASLST